MSPFTFVLLGPERLLPLSKFGLLGLELHLTGFERGLPRLEHRDFGKAVVPLFFQSPSLLLNAARLLLDLLTGPGRLALFLLQFFAVGQRRLLFTLGLSLQFLEVGLSRPLGFGLCCFKIPARLFEGPAFLCQAFRLAG